MAVILLILFPLLLMFDTRLAFAALAIAIVMIYRARTPVPHPPVQPPVRQRQQHLTRAVTGGSGRFH